MSGKSAQKRLKEAQRAENHLTRAAGNDMRGAANAGESGHSSVEFRSSVHVGPLPAPETMREYGEILGTAPERIIGMWERQAAHRQRLENRASWVESMMRPLALISALALAGGFGFLGWDLLRTGHDVGGFVGLIGALATLAGIFIARRRVR